MNEQSYEYRTGETRPGKSSRGLIAFLLICIIFLMGVVSLLGMMNIHLFRMLQQADQSSPLSFQEGNTDPTAGEDSLTVEGITVLELSEVYQQMNDLPAGLYVVDAPESGPVEPGDVLISCDNTAITTLEDLESLYNKKKTGEKIHFSFYRDGKSFSCSFPIDD